MPSQWGHGDPFNRRGKAQEERVKAKYRAHYYNEGYGKKIREAMQANGCTDKETNDMVDWFYDSKASRSQADNFIYHHKQEAKEKDRTNPNWRAELQIQRREEAAQEWAKKQAEADLAKKQEAKRIEEAYARLRKQSKPLPEITTVATTPKEPSKPISGDTILISNSFAIVAIGVFAAAFLVGRHHRDKLENPQKVPPEKKHVKTK